MKDKSNSTTRGMSEKNQITDEGLTRRQLATGVLGNWQGEVITKEGTLHLVIRIWPYQNSKQLVGSADILNRDERPFH